MKSERIYFIYKYTFPNGKIYIGQTYKGSRRFGKVSDYKGTLVYRAMNKHPNFTKEIIEYCNVSNVDEREKYWINFYDSMNRYKGYNRESGGNLNKELSSDLKRRLSIKHKDLYNIPVLQYDLQGNFIKEWKSEKAVEDALGLQINSCCQGRRKATGGFQWKKKNDERIISDIYNPIQQYDLNGNFVKEWNSIIEISKKLMISRTSISQCLGAKQKSAGGFQWKYKKSEKLVSSYKRNPSNTQFKKGHINKFIYNKKKVLQYNLEGELMKEWDSIASAEKALKLSNIGASARSKNYLAGGFQWKFSGDSKKISKYIKPKIKFSAEHNERLSKAKKGKPNLKLKGRLRPELSGIKNPRARKIFQLSLNGEIIKEWEYITKASKELGINITCISECLKGKQKTAGGYRWKYCE